MPVPTPKAAKYGMRRGEDVWGPLARTELQGLGCDGVEVSGRVCLLRAARGSGYCALNKLPGVGCEGVRSYTCVCVLVVVGWYKEFSLLTCSVKWGRTTEATHLLHAGLAGAYFGCARNFVGA
eukprot:scaffold139832_cov17-Tisochrysis_lutea.AAC.1